ncbi:MAG: hypothetical protein OEY28_06815 [Nitrospira sp.]|nr:hypothetical protein [Nitrospira sp.]
MANERDTMSPTMIGLGVLWPTCWTGIPIKLAFGLLAFALGWMELEGRLGLAFLMLLGSPFTIFAVPLISITLDGHFGEGIGLPILFLLSIPIDIWAFGVVGRTYFLERFRKEPPEALGFTLWWKSAVVGAFFLPVLWFVVSLVTETAVSTSQSLSQMESLRLLFNTGLPIAERIGLEVTIWGTVSFMVLFLLMVIGISWIGRIIREIAQAAQPSSDSYQALITRWDLMRVPSDQGVFMTAVTGVGIVLSLLFWVVLPVTTPHPHECCQKEQAKAGPPFKPMEVLTRAEQEIAQIEAVVLAIEQSRDAGKTASETDKKKGGVKAETRKAEGAPAVTQP